MRKSTRANAKSVKWKRSINHAIIMAVVDSAGQSYTRQFVLPENIANYHRSENGHYETPTDY